MVSASPPPPLVACHDCDLLVKIPPVPEGRTARCPRCRADLARGAPRTVERATALALATLVLLACANAFPFLRLEVQGRFTDATIPSSIVTLWQQDLPGLALIVLVTTLLAPLAQLTLLLYVLVPLGLGRVPPGAAPMLRALSRLRPWSMSEVFLLGVLVSMVKLADMADIVPGVALWTFGVMIATLTATLSVLDPPTVWARLDALRGRRAA